MLPKTTKRLRTLKANTADRFSRAMIAATRKSPPLFPRTSILLTRPLTRSPFLAAAAPQVPRSDASSGCSSPTSSRATDSLPATPRHHSLPLTAPSSPGARAATAAAHLGCPFDNRPAPGGTQRAPRPDRSHSTSSFDVNPHPSEAPRAAPARKDSGPDLPPTGFAAAASPPAAWSQPVKSGFSVPPSPPRRAPPLLNAQSAAAEPRSTEPAAADGWPARRAQASPAASSPAPSDGSAARSPDARSGGRPAQPSPSGAAEVLGDSRISPRSLFGAAEEITCPRAAYTLF